MSPTSTESPPAESPPAESPPAESPPEEAAPGGVFGSRSGLTLLQVVVPIGILVLGAVGTVALLSLRPEAGHADAAEVAVPVEVVELVAEPARAQVHGSGTVIADQQVVLTPQVGGRITWIADELRPGGRVEKGAALARIDARDYQLAVTQAQSQVAQARLNLDLEESRGKVAEREWELVGEGRSAEEAPLALRGPQLLAAEQSLAAAEASLATAELALERTTLRAPFDAVVLSEGIDVGQVVGATTQVATLVGADRLRVDVKVPVEQLPGLRIPGVSPDIESEGPSPARVVQQLTRGGAGQREIVRQGQVIGLGGQIDAATRTATVLVGIDDPFGDGSQLPLLPGAFVDVELEGRLVSDVVTIPRAALRDGAVAWVVDGDSRLDRREVEVGWREPDRVHVTAGLSAGERVVVSPMSLPIDGMAVRTAAASPEPAAAEPAAAEPAATEPAAGTTP